MTQEGTEVSAAYAKMQILFTQNTFLHPLLNPNFKIDSFYLFFIFGLFCRWYQLLCGGNGAPLLLRPVPARDAWAQLLSPRHSNHSGVDCSHWLFGQHIPNQCRRAVQLPERWVRGDRGDISVDVFWWKVYEMFNARRGNRESSEGEQRGEEMRQAGDARRGDSHTTVLLSVNVRWIRG